MYIRVWRLNHLDGKRLTVSDMDQIKLPYPTPIWIVWRGITGKMNRVGDADTFYCRNRPTCLESEKQPGSLGERRDDESAGRHASDFTRAPFSILRSDRAAPMEGFVAW